MTTLINDLAGPEKQMKEVVDQVRLLKPDSNQETSADGAIERGEPDKMNELVRATFYVSHSPPLCIVYNLTKTLLMG